MLLSMRNTFETLLIQFVPRPRPACLGDFHAHAFLNECLLFFPRLLLGSQRWCGAREQIDATANKFCLRDTKLSRLPLEQLFLPPLYINLLSHQSGHLAPPPLAFDYTSPYTSGGLGSSIRRTRRGLPAMSGSCHVPSLLRL